MRRGRRVDPTSPGKGCAALCCKLQVHGGWMPRRGHNRRHSARGLGSRAGASAPVALALLATLLLLAPGAAGALRAPVNLIPPTISGKAQVGKTLTASRGRWTGSPTSYAY